MEKPLKMVSNDLNFYYGDFKALTDISLAFGENQVTALIGPSGCGKSTYLRCMNRMNDLIPYSRVEGELLLDGENIYAPNLDVVTLRSRIGMVFQKPNPFPKSIFENVAYGLRVNGIKNQAEVQHQVEKSLKGAALWEEVKDRLHDSALGLSGGQQQRLCIARALANDPDVILADEPTGNLDSKSGEEIMSVFRMLNEQGNTLIVVTHDETVAEHADRRVRLRDGRIESDTRAPL